MVKSSNKEPLSPLFLSIRALQEQGAHPPNLAIRDGCPTIHSSYI
jgi:hypothetical protein